MGLEQIVSWKSLMMQPTKGTTPDRILSPGKSILDYNLELCGRQPTTRFDFLVFIVFLSCLYDCVFVCESFYLVLWLSVGRSCEDFCSQLRQHPGTRDLNLIWASQLRGILLAAARTP